MKKFSKFLSIVLSLALCLSLLPAAALAQGETPDEEQLDSATDTVNPVERTDEEETGEETDEKETDVETDEEETDEKETDEETDEKETGEETDEKETGVETDEKETDVETEEEIGVENVAIAAAALLDLTEEETEEEFEVPEGYAEADFSVNFQYMDQMGGYLGQYDRNTIDQNATYTYTYTIGDKEYTRKLDFELKELIPGTGIMGATGNRALKIPVPADGSSITVTIKMENLNTDDLDWYAANGYDTGWHTVEEREIKLTLSNAGGKTLWVYNYYQPAVKTDPDPEPEITEREVDIMVSFTEDMGKPSFGWDVIGEDYSLEYSYVDPKTGETVTDTLHISSAEREELPRWDSEKLDEFGNPTKKDDEVDHAFKWPLTLPVGVKGVYLSLNQSNYDIDGYEWSQVVGTTDRVDGGNIGQLYISFDNNPVTPYIRNVYRVPTPVDPSDPIDPTDPTDPIGPTDPGDTDAGGTVEITDGEVPLASAVGLNDVDHFAYLIGYEDDTVRPLDHITRAEVATIFFRLMTDLYRTINWSTTNDFSDVNEGDWCNTAVSTCANAGIMAGYADGTFRPNQTITRAEFVEIAAQFLDSMYTGENIQDFADTVGHRAAEEIRRCVEAGWVTTEEENFRPEDLITRAEVATIINRMLNRAPHEDRMVPTMKTWIDNPKGSDYYEDIQEATNDHEYERDELGTETWTNALGTHDWKAMEAQWAAEMSAAN